MRIIGIDPGTAESGICLVEDYKPVFADKIPNERVLEYLSSCRPVDCVAIESMQSYGMGVGREVFETCYWVGRFWERADSHFYPVHFYPKPKWARSLCGPGKIKDADVRRALIMRFGGDKNGEPMNILKGNSDKRSAFAVALYHLDGAKLGEW